MAIVYIIYMVPGYDSFWKYAVVVLFSIAVCWIHCADFISDASKVAVVVQLPDTVKSRVNH